MSIFSTVWIDGKIPNIESLLKEHSDRKFMFVLDTNFAIMARYYVTDIDYFNKCYSPLKSEFLHAITLASHKC